ncbi:MAG TPA: hypothetical protein VJV78_27630, partial [Polyangiales bacterium]|nr:hypothetical protein [Polyangiales bacterium]
MQTWRVRLRPYLPLERCQQRLLVALLLAAGCSSARSPQQQASGPQIERPAGSVSEPSAAKPAEPAAAASGDELAVRAAAEPASVCPGECSRLTAAASGGVGAYTYHWNRGLPDGPGPHMVCPKQSSDYVVTVTNSSDTGAEFAVVNPPVSTTVELRVADGPGCDAARPTDAGASDDGLDDAGESGAPDAGTRTEPTMIGTTERLCTEPLRLPAEIELLNPWGQQLVADAQGDLIAIVAFSHALRTSDGRVVKDVATQGSVLAKFAPDCKLRWSKQIGTTNNTLLLIAAATDRDNNIVTVGRISGRVQLESGTVMAGPESGLIVKWDASGKALWHRVITGSYQNYLFDVAVDEQGDVIVAGLADDGADLGAGPQGDPIDQSLYLAKYATADGAHRWSRRLPFAVALARISVLPSQHIVQLVTYDDGKSRELQEFDADGTLVRSLQSAPEPA